jgi:hypothetical protein
MFSDLASCFCFGANNYGLDFCLSSKRLDMALIFGFGEGVGNIWFGLGLYFSKATITPSGRKVTTLERREREKTPLIVDT